MEVSCSDVYASDNSDNSDNSDSDVYASDKCTFVLISGKNKGNQCSLKALKDSERCFVHSKQKNLDLVRCTGYDPKISPVERCKKMIYGNGPSLKCSAHQYQMKLKSLKYCKLTMHGLPDGVVIGCEDVAEVFERVSEIVKERVAQDDHADSLAK